jgi:branched-chain amino acid transport system permease protein
MVWQRRAAVVVALAAAIGLPFFVRDATIRPIYYQQIIDIAMIWALVTVSLTLLSGVAGQISLGQGGFMAVGAYASALLGVNEGWPFWITALIATLLAGVTGVLIGLPALRLKGPYLVMATLAFSGIVHGVVRNWQSVTRGVQGVPGVPGPELFGATFDTEFAFYFLLLGLLVVAIAIVRVLSRDDELAAESVGIRPAVEKTAAFGVSAAIAGLAGACLSAFIGFISPDFFKVEQSLLALTMSLIGGIASIPGAIVGAFGLQFLTESLRDFSQYQQIAYGVAILLVVTLIPDGIVGGLGRGITHLRTRRQRAVRRELGDAKP